MSVQGGGGAFLRFIAVGALNTALTFGCYVALVHFVHYQLAYAIAYAAGIVLQFLLHSRLVFRVPMRLANLAGYPPIHVVLYSFGAALLHVLVARMGMDSRIAPLLVIGLSIPLSFVLTRAWLARDVAGDVRAPDVPTPGAPLLSLVIPAYNEAGYLPRLLDSIDAARARFRGGAASVEVIVADNASTDSTAGIARSRGCAVASVEKRCIAAARNGGASLARGSFLCFVDADMRIHPETFNVVADTLAMRRVIAGATGVTLERWSTGILLTWMVMLPLIVLTRMDTGVVFCRRSDFEAIGGYDESRLFAEDVDFLWRLRKLGRPRGQGLACATRAKAIASMRKFDKYGDWHYFTQMPRLGWRMLRDPTARSGFVTRYWYEDR